MTVCDPSSSLLAVSVSGDDSSGSSVKLNTVEGQLVRDDDTGSFVQCLPTEECYVLDLEGSGSRMIATYNGVAVSVSTPFGNCDVVCENGNTFMELVLQPSSSSSSSSSLSSSSLTWMLEGGTTGVTTKSESTRTSAVVRRCVSTDECHTLVVAGEGSYSVKVGSTWLRPFQAVEYAPEVLTFGCGSGSSTTSSTTSSSSSSSSTKCPSHETWLEAVVLSTSPNVTYSLRQDALVKGVVQANAPLARSFQGAMEGMYRACVPRASCFQFTVTYHGSPESADQELTATVLTSLRLDGSYYRHSQRAMEPYTTQTTVMGYTCQPATICKAADDKPPAQILELSVEGSYPDFGSTQDQPWVMYDDNDNEEQPAFTKVLQSSSDYFDAYQQGLLYRTLLCIDQATTHCSVLALTDSAPIVEADYHKRSVLSYIETAGITLRPDAPDTRLLSLGGGCATPPPKHIAQAFTQTYVIVIGLLILCGLRAIQAKKASGYAAL